MPFIAYLDPGVIILACILAAVWHVCDAMERGGPPSEPPDDE